MGSWHSADLRFLSAVIESGGKSCQGSMMRIGLISSPWVPVPPPAYGGTEAIVDRLARGLIAAGHDVLLAAPGDSTCPVRQVTPIPVAADYQTGEGEVELSYVVRAYAAMGSVDLVHDHTLAGPLYARRPPEIPIVATNHGPFHGAFADIYRAAAHSAYIVAISAHQASTASGIEIARVIHHGVDVEHVPLGTGRGGYAVFLGRMSPDKGPKEALVAAREAGLRLVLAGRCRGRLEENYFAEHVAPLLGRKAEFVGEIDATRRYELLGAAAVLLNPIQWDEPFGLTMIESLACGTPVVATPYGSVPEIVEQGITGYMSADPAQLVTALRKAGLLDRSACREAAEDRFSTDLMVAEHLRLYDDVLSGRCRLST